MNIRPIKTPDEHRAAPRRIDELMEAETGPEVAELEVLGILVERYEKEAFPIDPPAVLESPGRDHLASAAGQHAGMSDKAQELYNAAFAVLPYLKASTDPYVREAIEELVKDRDLSAGDRLRREAEAADRRDAAILRLREAMTEFAASRAC